jgi:preprotein translocase subunit SecA
MAWRWTDIKLWKQVKDLWGLIILWTEKHETRRIDNQLRWRAWRQWDPWITQYLISPNDDIMRIFGWDKLFSVFNSPMFASLPDNEPLTQSGMLTRKVTWVQKQVEWHNFDIRKHILEYDDVINKHRTIIYGKRDNILEEENIDENIISMIKSQLTKLINSEIIKAWNNPNKKDLIKKINDFIGIKAVDDVIEIDDLEWFKNPDKIIKYVIDIALEELEKLKNSAVNLEEFYELERKIVLSSIDELWMRHIDSMSRLKEEVAFEWYAGRNPLVVYKEKAYEKFTKLINELEYKTLKAIFSVNKVSQIEQVNLIENDLELNEVDIDDIISIKKEEKNENIRNNSNPLFNKPNNWNNKIRI